MEVIKKTFGTKTIRMIVTIDDLWFCGKDIAKILGYVDTTSCLKKNVDRNDKKSLRAVLNEFRCINYNKKELISIYINKQGIGTLITYGKVCVNKKPILKWLKDNFEINYYIIKRLSKEEEYITNIITTFSHLTCKTQYKVDSYRIDLYLPEQNLAIECDEFGHSDRDESYEKEREIYIKNILNCTFIRFNPDSETFNIFKVINEIIRFIKHKN